MENILNKIVKLVDSGGMHPQTIFIEQQLNVMVICQMFHCILVWQYVGSGTVVTISEGQY